MSSGRGSRQRAVAWFRRWRFVLFVLFVAVFVAPGAIADIGAEKSVWDWIAIGCVVVLVAGLPLFVWDALRGDRPTPERLDPATVTDDAVHEVVSTSDDRMTAIRTLREAHPGLGLKDAADLVGRHR